ncbi:hypothetical protein V5799_015694, partial [Amblyomma americanum]
MLDSLGITTWPVYADHEGQRYEQILSKTGLRPLASVGVAPNEKKTAYMLTMNIIWPRFTLPPAVVKQKLKEQDDKYQKYKKFVASVLDLFRGKKKKPASSKRLSHEVGATEGAANSQSARDDRMKHVMDDILQVDMYLSQQCITGSITLFLFQLIGNISRQNFTIKKICEWQDHFGKQLPITEGLKNDFSRAGAIFNSDDFVGIHNIEYFNAVGAYMSSLTP